MFLLQLNFSSRHLHNGTDHASRISLDLQEVTIQSMASKAFFNQTMMIHEALYLDPYSTSCKLRNKVYIGYLSMWIQMLHLESNLEP